MDAAALTVGSGPRQIARAGRGDGRCTKVLAIFDRSEPRDFIDLAALTERFELEDLIELAREKDPGLDLEVIDAFMARVHTLPRPDFDHDDRAHQQLLRTVDDWRSAINHLHDRELANRRSAHPDPTSRRPPGTTYSVTVMKPIRLPRRTRV